MPLRDPCLRREDNGERRKGRQGIIVESKKNSIERENSDYPTQTKRTTPSASKF
jgi:hypothetical protein